MKALRVQLWVILILETPFWSFAAVWFVFLYNTALIHSLTALTKPTTHIIVSLNSSLTINCHFVCAARFFSWPCRLFCDTLSLLLSPVSINTNLCPCSCQMLLSSDACCVYLEVYSPFILNARLSNLKQRLTGEGQWIKREKMRTDWNNCLILSGFDAASNKIYCDWLLMYKLSQF